METFEVASFHIQGQDVILVLVSPSVAGLIGRDKAALLAQLQRCAAEADLPGTVALVWQVGGRLDSYGPAQWAPFLRSLRPADFGRNRNHTLTCG